MCHNFICIKPSPTSAYMTKDIGKSFLILYHMQKQWQDQITSRIVKNVCKPKRFEHDNLMMDVFQQDSALFNTDLNKQASSIEIKKMIVLITWMNQLIIYDKVATNSSKLSSQQCNDHLLQQIRHVTDYRQTLTPNSQNLNA